MPGKNPMLVIYWKQKSEALKKQIEKRANEKISAKEEAKKPKGHMKPWGDKKPEEEKKASVHAH